VGFNVNGRDVEHHSNVQRMQNRYQIAFTPLMEVLWKSEQKPKPYLMRLLYPFLLLLLIILLFFCFQICKQGLLIWATAIPSAIGEFFFLCTWGSKCLVWSWNWIYCLYLRRRFKRNCFISEFNRLIAEHMTDLRRISFNGNQRSFTSGIDDCFVASLGFCQWLE
jgi:hypothetical protein